MKSNGVPIGEVAARFGLETHVLRHWEDVGLLRPARDAAGRRLYTERDAVRVAVVLCNKAAGMTLEQIAVLLDAPPEGRDDVLRAHLGELERRVAELERARSLAEHALHCKARDVATCPRFRIHVSELSVGIPGERAAARKAAGRAA